MTVPTPDYFVFFDFHRATERLKKDIDSLSSHLQSEDMLRSNAADSVSLSHEEAEDLFSQMKELADSESGQRLFEHLKQLNEVLEGSGVKAFGDLDESSYKTSGQQWNINALTEDIEACKIEMQLQVRMLFAESLRRCRR